VHLVDISRADFLKIAVLSGGAGAAGGVLVEGAPDLASAASGSSSQDANILNYLLLIEYVQAAFYQDAIDKGSLSGELARFAEVVGRHERTHVNALRSQLGARARHRPTFDFGDATASPTKFATRAIQLEELGLGAYIGQGANVSRQRVLRIARIVTVEGRHAAWIRDIQRQLPAPAAADRAFSQSKVIDELQATGYITGGGE
jgi:Ferritin-like domain